MSNPNTFVLISSREAVRVARPFLDACAREHEVSIVEINKHTTPDWPKLTEKLNQACGVLLIGSRRHSPRTAVPGLFVADATGRDIPVGWLPFTSDAALHRFACTAAAVRQRVSRTFNRETNRGAKPAVSIAILGQWQERFMHLAQRMQSNLNMRPRKHISTVRWTAERITRDDLIPALRTGLGMAIYFGHGRPSGWAGYHGVRAHHLEDSSVVPGFPLGALASVTCLTASRWHVGLSFSEAVVLNGVCASALGAVQRVDHIDNMRWMVGLARALTLGETRLGAALLQSIPKHNSHNVLRQSYRIIGDPLAPLLGVRNSLQHAQAILAPAADADLGAGPQHEVTNP